MADYNVAQLEDTDGNLAKILAKRLESAIQFALSGDVSGTSESTFLDGDVNITVQIGAGKVTESKIATDAVTTSKIKDSNVTESKIATDAVTTSKIKDSNVTESKIATDAVTTSKIKDSNVTYGKIDPNVYGGSIAEGSADKLATKVQVKQYVEGVVSGQGTYRGKQTVATINSWTVANLNNGDRVMVDGSGTVTIDGHSLAVRDGEDLTLWKYVDGGVTHAYWQSHDGEFKLKQTAKSDPTASGTTITAIDSITQNENGDITATKKTIRSATTSQSGVVQLLDSHASTATDKAATPKNVKEAYDLANGKQDPITFDGTYNASTNKAATVSTVTNAVNALDATKISSDGTNIQVKVTEVDGKITAVNVTTDNTASAGALNDEISARTQADTTLGNRATALESGKEDKSNKVKSTAGWSQTLSDDKYPSEKLVKESLYTKANKSEMTITAVSGDSTKKNIQLKTGTSQEVLVAHQDISGKQDNLAFDGTYNASSNKAATVSTVTTAVNNLGSVKEDKSNKVTAWQTTPDDTHYPSEKLVKDSIDAISGDSTQRQDEHELNHDNPHAVNKVQLSIPNLGNCIYDSNTHTLKMLDMSFTAKGTPVETDDPQIGDALYVDGSGNKHYLKGGDMLKGTTIPSGYLPVGVVIQRRGDDVLVHYYNCNETKRFASAWMWEITGMTLDGASHSIVFRQRKNETEYVNIGTFTYTASTLADFCTALDTWLRSHPGGTAAGAGWNYDWHCEYMENYLGNMACIVIADVMSDYRQANSIVASGATATMNFANALPTIGDSTGFERVGGTHGTRAGANANRIIEYFTSNPGTIATLTSDVTPTTANVVVSKTQFESDSHCAPLRAVYKTYAEYIKKCVMLKWPALTYGMKTSYGKQKEWTYALSGKTHKKKDGTTTPTFPAVSYAGSIAFNSPGLESGCWRMMGIEDTYEMISKMKAGLSDHTTYASYDIVNKTLNAMGGAIVSLDDHRWLAVRSSDNYAWMFSSAGIFRNNAFNSYLRVSAVALLTL